MVKNKRLIGVIAPLLLLFLIFTVGCSAGNVNKAQEKPAQVEKKQASFPVTVTDDMGHKVTLEKEPERLISLAPSNTEILYALGCQDRLVGVTSYCDYPKDAKKKEKVGTFASPNLEKILSLKPDVVFLTDGVQAPVIKRLEEAKITTFVVSPKTVNGMIDDLTRIGKVVGSENRAKSVSDNLKKRLAKVESTLSHVKKKKTAFYELYHEPLMTVGAKSPINDILNKAGVINIAGDIQSAYPQYSLETLVQKNPDVYLASTGSMQSPGDILKRSGWAGLSAVKNNRVYVFDENIINRPGPRMIDAVEKIAAAVYPDLFTKK